MRLRNDPKCTQTLCNAPKHEFRVQWSGLGAFVAKHPDVTSWHVLLYYCTSSQCFALCFMQLRNDPKCSQTLCSAPKHEFRVQWGGLGAFVAKNSDLTGTNFCINCTSSPRFASSFMQLWNDPKCTQTLCNAPKHEFGVEWGGLGAFVEKNPSVILWHELSH